jgi:hypothetical protein
MPAAQANSKAVMRSALRPLRVEQKGTDECRRCQRHLTVLPRHLRFLLGCSGDKTGFISF